MMSWLSNFRMNHLLRRGFAIRKLTRVEHYWLEADGNPDAVTTEILLQKNYSFKTVTSKGDVREYIRDVHSQEAQA